MAILIANGLTAEQVNAGLKGGAAGETSSTTAATSSAVSSTSAAPSSTNTASNETPVPTAPSTSTRTRTFGASLAKGPGAHQLVGYWQNYPASQQDAKSQPKKSKNLKLSEIPSEYDIVIAFVANTVAATPGAVDFLIDPYFIPGYTLANFKTEAKQLKAKGKKLLLSVGGQYVQDALVKDAKSAAAFSKSVIGLMDDCGFDGIDIDLEHGMDVENLSAAIKTISDAKPNTVRSVLKEMDCMY